MEYIYSKTKSPKFLSVFLMLALAVPVFMIPATADALTAVCNESATQTIVSDTTTFKDNISPTFIVSPIHSFWTASISGATWVWGENPISDAVSQTSETFTRTFTIVGTPTGATLDIAADNSYVVSVNDNAISDATEFNYTSGGQDTYSIPASSLLSGPNTITFTVTNWAMAEGTMATNPAGLLYKLVVNNDECQIPPTTGTIEITKYACLADTVPSRDANGPDSSGNHITPTGCTPQSGAYFSYENSSASTYPGLDGSYLPIPGYSFSSNGGSVMGATASGVLTASVPANGQAYNIAETDSSGVVLPSVLGLYCNGDTDTSKNDNYEQIPSVGAGETKYCVAYNQKPVDQVLLGNLYAEDFGVVNYDSLGNGILKGYTSGWGLTDTALASTTSVVVQLFAADNGLLQTNTAIMSAFSNLPGVQFTSPFDVSGTFNYGTDGYWTNARESQYGQSVPAYKVVATVTLANGKVVTAENILLTGDPTTIEDPKCEDSQHLDNHVCVANQVPALARVATSGRVGMSSRPRDISNLLASNAGVGGVEEVLGASTGPACEEYLKSYIKLGANNDPEEVKKLQIFLNQFFEVKNPVTGFYGPITYGMVKKFQTHQNVAVLTPWSIAGFPTDGPTGYVYKTTKRWINILKCPETVVSSPIPSLP